jgi:hypothetical protein
MAMKPCHGVGTDPLPDGTCRHCSRRDVVAAGATRFHFPPKGERDPRTEGVPSITRRNYPQRRRAA